MNEGETTAAAPRPPLVLDVTGRAEAEVYDALTWLFGFSPASAERFRAVLPQELADLCQSVADRLAGGGSAAGLGRLPVPDAEASQHFSRPVFQHRFTTAAKRKRRGSSAGVWRVFYALADRDGDGRADTLSVLSLRHGAAAPFAPPDAPDDHEAEGGRP